jgi:hypothetical protein
MNSNSLNGDRSKVRFATGGLRATDSEPRWPACTSPCAGTPWTGDAHVGTVAASLATASGVAGCSHLALLHQVFPLVQRRLTLIGPGLARVGPELSLIGAALTLVG